ncbi:unnamed protein product [Closterium sp. NIES-65]|nr:unnamed protein product [Closterium sp. NIES-65]
MRRYLVEMTPVEPLAENRTRRVDPLQHFQYYEGGWDPSSKDYWAVALSLIRPLPCPSLSSLPFFLPSFLPPSSVTPSLLPVPLFLSSFPSILPPSLHFHPHTHSPPIPPPPRPFAPHFSPHFPNYPPVRGMGRDLRPRRGGGMGRTRYKHPRFRALRVPLLPQAVEGPSGRRPASIHALPDPRATCRAAIGCSRHPVSVPLAALLLAAVVILCPRPLLAPCVIQGGDGAVGGGGDAISRLSTYHSTTQFTYHSTYHSTTQFTYHSTTQFTYHSTTQVGFALLVAGGVLFHSTYLSATQFTLATTQALVGATHNLSAALQCSANTTLFDAVIPSKAILFSLVCSKVRFESTQKSSRYNGTRHILCQYHPL